MGKKYDDAMKRLEAITKAIPGQIEAKKAEADGGRKGEITIEIAATTAYASITEAVSQVSKETSADEAARSVIDMAVAGSTIGALGAMLSLVKSEAERDKGCKCGGCEDASERG